jgi:hypothetical protein
MLIDRALFWCYNTYIEVRKHPMEFLVEARSIKKRKFVEAILPSMIGQLGLTASRKAVVIRIANECEGMGITVPVDILDSYVVVINPRLKLKELGLTLAHEMVHVRQMAKGFLKSKNGHNYWCGKRYGKKTKYLDLPWEQDAFARQEIIFRKAIEE